MAKTTSPGMVNADEAYTIPEIQKRLRCAAWTLKIARNKGLKIRKFGRRRMILGRDLIDFLGKQPPVVHRPRRKSA